MIKKNLCKAIQRLRGIDCKDEYLEIRSINNKVKLMEFQEKYLRGLILHSYKNIPYYHNIFKKIGIIHGETVDLSKFNQIPILTKDIIRKHQQELISKDYITRNWFYKASGGSTGEPVRHVQDDIYTRWAKATKNYYHQVMLGIDESNVRKIILWGSERDLFQKSIGLNARISNWLENTIFLNSFKMTERDIEQYIKVINSYKPDLIRGYAVSLFGLCEYAERNNLEIYTPKILISTAETLTSEMKQKIENVFGTKLYNFYGSREVSSLAGECNRGLMHVFMFHNYIEILDINNRLVIDDQEGKIIVTNLHNYSMPLIRYEIGDMAVSGPEKCECQNVLPTLKKITGRITDHFLREDGTIVPAEFFIHLIGVVCNKGSIKKFQVIQEEYRKIKILVVPTGKIIESEKKDIEDKIKLLMRQDCKIIWKFVDEIPNTKSGKYLYTKSLVWR